MVCGMWTMAPTLGRWLTYGSETAYTVHQMREESKQ